MTRWMDKMWKGALLLALCGTWLLGGLSAAYAQKKCRARWSQKIRLELREQPLLEIVKKISELTCYNFIVSDQVRARKISLISEKAVSLRDIYRAFLSMLEISDLSVVRQGAYRRIVFARQALQQPIPFRKGRFRDASQDQLTMYMLSVKHIDVFQLNNVLRQLIAGAGRTIVFQPSSIILIVDYANNIRRLLKITKELDVPDADVRERMYIVQIENGQAQEMVQRVQAIFRVQQLQRNSRGSSNNNLDEDYRISKIIADERTNRVIIVAGPTAFMNARSLISKLDLALPDGGQIRLTRLRFAKADEIAQTLSQLSQGRGAVRGRKVAARASSTDLFQGEIRITPDKATNSLVIVANQRDYESLMRVIRKLDVRRKQIFIEAVIMEVSLEKTRDLGVAFHGGAPLSNDANNPSFALFGTRLSGLNSLVLDPAALMGLALGLQGPALAGTSGLLGTGTSIPSFGVVLRAMQTNSDVDLISTPHVLTTTNEEATLQVGQNVPFIAGTNFSTAGGIGFPVQNIQRQDVALTLKLKPQVNAGDRVKLEIDIELTEIAAQNRELGPTTTKRKVKTTVRVRDNQTVVIGGLIRDRKSVGLSKVPVLGDIPLLGALFRVEQRSVEKRNLLIFMTPHIVLDESDFRKIFQQKMRERQEFLENYYMGKYKELRDRVKLNRSGILDRVLGEHDRIQARTLIEQKRVLRRKKLEDSSKEPPRVEQVSIKNGSKKKNP